MTSAENYRRFCSRLASLRWIAVFGQLVALLAGARLLHALEWQPMLGLTLALFVANLVIWQRLKSATTIAAQEAFSHLLLDVLVLSALLYFSGGASNPFVSLYLLPVALAATVLPIRYVVGLVVICTLGYSLLFLFAPAMPHVHGVHGSDFDMHLAGMWLNFVVTAVLIAGFVTSLATAVRQRDASLAAASESAERQRSVIRVGALAAGAAHELGSPLSTMAMLVEEMKRDAKGDQKQEDLELLGQQIDVCRHHLDRLFSQRADTELSLAPWLESVTEQFRAVRPECVLNVMSAIPNSAEQVPAVVEQALFTVLDNAADASIAAGEQSIELQVLKTPTEISLVVIDQGAIAVNWSEALKGSGKPDGRGVGLNVARIGMETINGNISFEAAESGSRVTIRWVGQ